MMNSAREHYEEAERLLALAREEPDSISRHLILAEAQVHATLALSAPAGKGPPGPGHAQTGSTASTRETRPVVPARGAESVVLPHMPPWPTAHPTWHDDLAPTGPLEVTGKRTPTEKPSMRPPAEPPGDPSPSPSGEDPDPEEQESGPAGQSPAAGRPGDQRPGDQRPGDFTF
jgi:hypothetical protein